MTSSQVRAGIIGAGNCARALIEGIAFYRAHPGHTAGLMFPVIGPYGPGDIEPVAAWDVDAAKVGLDLWSARTAGCNLDVGIGPAGSVPVGKDVIVQPGPVLDGAGERYKQRMTLAAGHPVTGMQHVADQVREAGAEVLLNYLPVGSQRATEWWASVALEAGATFVNCVPVFIARHESWQARFRTAGLPLIGDDIKSQLGATYLHRAIVRAFAERGIELTRTYQLNVGGNMDFFNMLESSRLASKRESKSSAVTSAYDHELPPDSVHIGPSDYVGWLGDTKKAFIRCEGRGFGGAPIELEVQLTVPDSPNSAGVVIDAARIARLAMDRRDPAVGEHASAWLFKAPPRSVAALADAEARARLERWIAG